MLQLNWLEAFTFIRQDSRWKTKLLIGGALFIPLPPLGWVLALGYRGLTGLRLLAGREPVLPPWQGNFGDMFRRGLKASGVILSHFAPFLLAYWFFVLPSWAAAVGYWSEILLFFGLIAFCPPIFLPAMPIVYWWGYNWVQFTPFEALVLAVLFLGSFFILPASFVQVGLRGRYLDAFRVFSAWRFALGNLRVYLEAWLLSLVVSVLAVLSGVLMPWGLFWSYLAILHAFTQALSRWDTAEVRQRFSQCRLIPFAGAAPAAVESKSAVEIRVAADQAAADRAAAERAAAKKAAAERDAARERVESRPGPPKTYKRLGSRRARSEAGGSFLRSRYAFEANRGPWMREGKARFVQIDDGRPMAFADRIEDLPDAARSDQLWNFEIQSEANEMAQWNHRAGSTFSLLAAPFANPSEPRVLFRADRVLEARRIGPWLQALLRVLIFSGLIWNYIYLTQRDRFEWGDFLVGWSHNLALVGSLIGFFLFRYAGWQTGALFAGVCWAGSGLLFWLSRRAGAAGE